MCQGSFNEVSKKFQENYKSVSRKFQGCFMKVSRKIEECFKGSFQGVSKIFERNSKFKGCFKWDWRLFHWSFKWVLRVFKISSNGCLRQVSKLLPGCFKEDWVVLVETFKDDLKELQRYLKELKGCFKGVSRCFKEVSRAYKESIICVSRKLQKNKFQWWIVLRFCCCMDLIAAKRAKKGLVWVSVRNQNTCWLIIYFSAHIYMTMIYDIQLQSGPHSTIACGLQ